MVLTKLVLFPKQTEKLRSLLSHQRREVDLDSRYDMIYIYIFGLQRSTAFSDIHFPLSSVITLFLVETPCRISSHTPSVQLRLGLPFLLLPCGVHNKHTHTISVGWF
jgi:hypothetical protein